MIEATSPEFKKTSMQISTSRVVRVLQSNGMLCSIYPSVQVAMSLIFLLLLIEGFNTRTNCYDYVGHYGGHRCRIRTYVRIHCPIRSLRSDSNRRASRRRVWVAHLFHVPHLRWSGSGNHWWSLVDWHSLWEKREPLPGREVESRVAEAELEMGKARRLSVILMWLQIE